MIDYEDYDYVSINNDADIEWTNFWVDKISS